MNPLSFASCVVFCVLPLLTSYRSVVVSPILGIVWITGIGVAIVRYGLLSWTPSAAGADIIASIAKAGSRPSPGTERREGRVPAAEAAVRRLPEPGLTAARRRPIIEGRVEPLRPKERKEHAEPRRPWE